MQLERFFNLKLGLNQYGLPDVQQRGQINNLPIQTLLSTAITENIMTPNNQVAVQSITYIYGVPQDQVTDAQIFERIASIELAMSELAKIKAKSTKISEKIASYKADIAALVAIVDSRD